MVSLRKLLGAQAKRFKYLAFLLVLTVGAYRDYLVLFSSSAAVGLDGYYYVLQVDGLTNGGLLFSTHTPVIFYYLACVRFLLGDTIIAIKVGTIILELLLCFGIGCLLIRITKSWSLGILGAGYTALAGLHRFMIGEFVNNLGALSFIIAAIFCLESARQSANKRFLWLAVSLLCFLMAIGSHRSALFVFVAIGLAAWWGLALRKATSERKRWTLVALLGLFVVMYFSPYLALAQPFIHLPERLTRELSVNPRWPVTPYTIFDVVSLLWTAPLILVTAIKKSWSGMTDRFHALLPGLAFFSIILNLSMFVNPDLIAFGMLGRLQTLMYLQVALFVPYAIWLLSQTNRRHAAYATAFSIPLLILSMYTSLPPGLQPEYLRNRERLIKALPEGVADIPRDSVIVAAHGEQFVITSLTGISSQHALSQTKAESTYWMLHQFPPSFVRPPVRSLMSQTDGSPSVLIRNDELWQLWPQMSSGAQERMVLGNLTLRQYFSDH
jgi:hypothetical protein